MIHIWSHIPDSVVLFANTFQVSIFISRVFCFAVSFSFIRVDPLTVTQESMASVQSELEDEVRRADEEREQLHAQLADAQQRTQQAETTIQQVGGGGDWTCDAKMFSCAVLVFVFEL